MVQFGKVGIRPSGLTPPNPLVLSLDSSDTSSYNGSGSMWYDLTTKGNNATFINTPTFSANNSGILQFDGGNYATINDDASLEFGNGAFSTEMWIKFSTLKGYQGILSKPGYSDGNGFVFLLESNNTFMMYAGNGGWQIGLGGQVTPNVDEWYHVVITRTSSGNWKMYINGQDQSGGVGANPSFNFPDETTPMYIGTYTNFPGSYNTPAGNFEGYLGFVKVWKGKSLSQNEVTAFFNNNTSRFANGGNNETYGKVEVDGTQYNTSLMNGTLYNANTDIYTFDGVDDYSFIDNVSFNTSDFTISWWENPNSTQIMSIRKFGNIPNTYWSPNDWVIGQNTTTDFAFYVYNYSNSSPMFNISITPDEWQHITITRFGDTWKLFINGVEALEPVISTVSLDGGENRSFYLGSSGSLSSELWNGLMSNVEISHFALSSTDVLNNYNSTKNNYGIFDPPPPVVPGKILIDGTQYNTTLNNGAVYNQGSNTYTFDGNDDYGILANGPKPTTEMSIGAWVNAEVLGGHWRKAICFPYDENSWTPPYFSYQLASVENYLTIGFAVDNDYNTGSIFYPGIVENTWYYVVGTFNNGIIKMYVNGELVETKDVTSSGTNIIYTNQTDLMTGLDALYFQAEQWQGQVSDVQVLTTELSSTDVLNNYNSTKNNYGIFDPPPFVGYSLVLPFESDYSDASDNNLVATVVGNPSISSDSKLGNGSMFIENSGDGLSYPSSELFNFGNYDFTIESWVKFSNTDDSQAFFTNYNTWDYDAIFLGRHPGASGKVSAWFYDGSSLITLQEPEMTTNEWVHYSLVRYGNNISLYKNGISVDTVTVSNTGWNQNHVANVGFAGDNPSGFGTQGYLDSFKVSKGVARYTSNFTPEGYIPPVGPGKILIDGTQYNTSLMNGTLYNTNTDIYTFDGVDDYSFIDNVSFNTSDFTISWWENPNSTQIMSIRKFGNIPNTYWSPNDWVIGQNTTTDFAFYVYNYSNSSPMFNISITPDTWQHIAITRFGDTWRLFINGVEALEPVISTVSLDGGENRSFYLGSSGSLSSELWNGLMSTVEVSHFALSSTDVLNHFNSTKVSYGFIPTGSMKINGVESTTSLMNGALYDSNTDVYSFNGSNYAEKSNFLGSTNTFTVSNWINLSYDQAGRTIFSNFAPGEGGWVTGISDSTNNKVKFYLGGATLLSNTTLNANTWYHVVVTYDNGSPKIYINGTLDNSSNNTINFSNGSYYGNDIGRLGSGGQTFAGNVAKVDVHTYALSSTDIEQEFNDTKTQFGY